MQRRTSSTTQRAAGSSTTCHLIQDTVALFASRDTRNHARRNDGGPWVRASLEAAPNRLRRHSAPIYTLSAWTRHPFIPDPRLAVQ